jgi:hypothetical protein
VLGQGETMPRDWFSTRGQIVQVICAFLGLCLGIFTAWPQLNTHMDIASAWPILVYPIAIFAIFQAGRYFGKTAAPVKEEPIQTKTELFKPTIKIGAFWETGSSFSRVRITAISIQTFKSDGNNVLGVELLFDRETVGALVGGAKPERTNYNRFYVPISSSGFQTEDASVFTFETDDNNIDLFILRVDHINQTAQEVSLVFVRQGTYFK